jgi:peptidase M48-like protein
MKKIILILFLFLIYSQSILSQCLVSGNTDLSNLEYYTNAQPWDTRATEEISKIESLFNVRAEVMYSDLPIVNARAFSENNHGYDGTIVIYDGLIKFLRGKDYLYFTAILAHEYGHILQYKLGYSNIHLSDKQIELFADYLSGVYLNFRITSTTFRSNDDLQTYKAIMDKAKNIYSIYGDELGDDSFGVSDPHGSPQERSRALSSLWGDLLELFPYIQNHRTKQNGMSLKIYADDLGRWLTLGELFYAQGLITIPNRF